MKCTAGLIGGAVAIAVTLPTVAQMMHQGNGMGGGRRAMINLVSPADSPTQIRRGTVMVGQHMFGMGQSSVEPGMPGPSGNGTPGTVVVLRLYGVSDANGLITSTGNRFIFQGELTTPTSDNTPIAIDQAFALNSGSVVVQVRLNLPSVTGPATIIIDRVAVVDGGGHTFATPGIALAEPAPQMTPRPTPGGSCTNDSDCNDGDPNTQDVCTPMGCRNTSGHMGGPMM
jgi:hypothetical protein